MPRSPVRYAPRVESRPVPDVPAARPFLKWAGGKTQLLSELDSAVPDFGGQYFEPFLGGGALFFRLASTRPGLSAHLNDINHDLVTAYESVRDQCEAVVTALEILEETYLEGDSDARERTYYEVRGKRPSDGVAVAARLIFLNKTCFNGLFYTGSLCCELECLCYEPIRARVDLLRVGRPAGAGADAVSPPRSVGGSPGA